MNLGSDRAAGDTGRALVVPWRPEIVPTIDCPKRERGRRPYIGVAALSTALVLSSSGCAILGAGIGSTIPKYEPLSEEPLVEQASLGQRVRVVRASDGWEVAGQYAGVYDEKLWVKTPGGSSSVDTRDVKSARVASGDHWLEGFFVGLGVDVVVLTVVGSNLRYFLPRANRNVSVGANGVDVAGQ